VTDSILDRSVARRAPMLEAAALPRRKAPPFIEEVRRFKDFGRASLAASEGGVPYLVNEFWTASQRQGHALQELSYRACFKPQLPEFFITRLTAPGEAVYDPFMGRGTTPLQAALMGRRPLGNDANPLSVLLTRPRLSPPPLAEIARRLETIDWNARETRPEPLLAFYSPKTLGEIVALRRWLLDAGRASAGDPCDDWIRMVALNRLTGHSPGFFSVYTLPPNQAVSVEAQRKINARRNQSPPDRDVKALILRKSVSLLRQGTPPSHPTPLLCVGPAQATPSISGASVDLVVTSPPFLDVVQYAEDNWLRNWFAGVEAPPSGLAIHRTENAWTAMVRETLAELARVVRPGGYVAFEVGEVRNGKVLLERRVWEAAAGLPFDRLFVMVNEQAFTKTANCWGVSNNAKGTNTNRIVILRRRG
jgi:hypothetical protein